MAASEQTFERARVNVPVQQEKRQQGRPKLHPDSAVRYAWLPPVIVNRDMDGEFKPGIQTTFIRSGRDFLNGGDLLAFYSFDYPVRNPNDKGASLDPATGLLSGVPQPIMIAKSASEVEEDFKTSEYAREWGMAFLDALTPLDKDADAAFEVFQTVHPYVYDMAALEYELTEGAKLRIAEAAHLAGRTIDEPYYVPDGRTFRVERRTITLAEAAEKVRAEMLKGFRIAQKKAEGIYRTSMLSQKVAASGGAGKADPDPLDLNVYRQTGRAAPSFIFASPGGGADDGTKELLQRLAEVTLAREEGKLLTAEDVRKMLDEQKAEFEQKFATAGGARDDAPDPTTATGLAALRDKKTPGTK